LTDREIPAFSVHRDEDGLSTSVLSTYLPAPRGYDDARTVAAWVRLSRARANEIAQ